MRFRPTTSIIALFVLAGLGTACGSDDSSARPPRPASLGQPSAEPGGAATDDTSPEVDRVLVPATPEQVARYTEAMAQALQGPSSDLDLDPATAECLAPRFLAVLDVDQLMAAGVTPEDLESGAESDLDGDFGDRTLTREEGLELYDSYGACGVDLRTEFLAAWTPSRASSEAKACIERAMTEDRFRSFLAATFIADDDDELMSDPHAAPLLNDITDCSRAYG